LACNPNVYAPLKGNLSNNELVGDWKPTDDSVTFLKKYGICCENKEIKLTLSADNSFVLTNMPDCWANSSGECKGETFSYKGDWEIYHDKSYNRLHLKEISVIRSIPLVIRKGTTQIVFTFGDADEGREIYLVKQ